jgi:hypothetical protein
MIHQLWPKSRYKKTLAKDQSILATVTDEHTKKIPGCLL